MSPIIYGGSSGGGYQAVTMATKTLNNAEIKALAHPTPITIVAAPGAGFMLVPLHAMLRLTWAADYTGIDPDAKLYIEVSAGSGGVALGRLVEATYGDVTSLLAFGESSNAWLPPLAYSTAAGNDVRGASGFTGIENAPIRLVADNGTLATDFTGGNAGNSLKVTLLYYTVTF